MKIAIEGCCHGEIETIYNSLVNIENVTGKKIDLLICCGDYEALRNQNDLKSLAVKPKYRTMGSFYKYYSGALKAPMLTLVIGGNHESSNYFSEINNGGWLCENIYFLGRSNVVTFGGIRIGGLSGIYKDYDYQKGYFEVKPFTEDHLRSIYHVRELDIMKLSQIEMPRLEIMFSHDWPMGIIDHGDRSTLMRYKKELLEDSDKGQLGNPATMTLLKHLKPKFWFSAHLHCKFAACYSHVSTADIEKSTEMQLATNSDNDDSNNVLNTRFLALDKVLPNRDFLQVLEFPEKSSANDNDKSLINDATDDSNNNTTITTTTTTTDTPTTIPPTTPTKTLKFCYDLQWLLIQCKTKQITNSYNSASKTPLNQDLFKDLYTPLDIERIEARILEIYKLQNPDIKEPFSIQDALEIKQSNFVKNTYCHDPENYNVLTHLPPAFDNPQNIVYENLIRILSDDSEITLETIKQLDVSTFTGNLEELQKEQIKNNQQQRNNRQQQSNQQQQQQQQQQNNQQQIDQAPQQQPTQYKDESEITLDD